MGKIDEATEIITSLGFPRQQQNERSALCLLSLLNLSEDMPWASSHNPLMGITPMMTFASDVYGKTYAPNTRETFRRQTMHQFVAGALALYNPDKPTRAVNSPKAVYQIAPRALSLIKTFGSDNWKKELSLYLKDQVTLKAEYAKKRDIVKLPVKIKEGLTINISPGKHSQLIKDIIEEFAPRFAPNAELIYVGDTGEKIGYFDKETLQKIGVTVDSHGKMPDVVLHYTDKNWLLLIEAVTSHGPVDAKRHKELEVLFKDSTIGIVYVTAFPSKKLLAKYLDVISWETEVWTAENPTHLIHFNGVRFLGPYDQKSKKNEKA